MGERGEEIKTRVHLNPRHDSGQDFQGMQLQARSLSAESGKMPDFQLRILGSSATIILVAELHALTHLNHPFDQ